MTLNELISHIDLFGQDHQQVNTVYFGTREQVDSAQTGYGMVQWFYVTKGSLQPTVAEFTFDVAFMDVLNNDLSNEADVLSDTLRVCENFLAYMEAWAYDLDYQLVRETNTTWFTHGADSDYAGHTVTIRVSLPKGYNNVDSCDLPLSSSITVDESYGTLNGFKKILEEFASKHLSLNYYKFGRDENIDFEDSYGSIMWWYVSGSNGRDTMVEQRYNIMLLDVVNSDLGNQADVLSDTHMVVNHLLSYLDSKALDAGYQINRTNMELSVMSHYPTSDYFGWELDFGVMLGRGFDIDKTAMDRMLVNEDGWWIVDHNGSRIIA